MSKASEFLDVSTPELEGRLHESRRELLNLRFQLATGQLDNTARIQQVRREVARLMTVIRERELGVVRNKGRASREVARHRAREADRTEEAEES